MNNVFCAHSFPPIREILVVWALSNSNLYDSLQSMHQKDYILIEEEYLILYFRNFGAVVELSPVVGIVLENRTKFPNFFRFSLLGRKSCSNPF